MKTVEQAKQSSQRYTEQFTRLVEDFEQKKGEIIHNAVEAKFLHQMSNTAEKTLTKELQFARADIKSLKKQMLKDKQLHEGSLKSFQRKCNIAEQRLESLETIANETKLIELKRLNEKLNDTFESEKRQIARDHEQVLSTMRMEKEKLNLAIVHHEASEKHALASYSILKMCSTEKWEPSIGIQSHESHIQAMKAMYNILLNKEEQLFQVYSNAQNNESKTSIKQDSYHSAYQNPEGKLKVASSNSGVNSTKNKILVDPAFDQITLMREIEELKVQLSDYATQETNLTFALQANSKSFHRHFGDEIFQRWYVNNISRLMKDFSIDSQKQAQIMDKLKESLIAYTHKNKITVNAYIEDEEENRRGSEGENHCSR